MLGKIFIEYLWSQILLMNAEKAAGLMEIP